MGNHELKSFLQNVCTKPEMLEELRSLLATSDAAIRWAGERGYLLTPEDVAELQRCCDQELSDDELDKVAGGDDAWPPPPPPPKP